MNEQEVVIEGIFNACDVINGRLPENQRLGRDLKAPLLGKQSQLDSLEAINLIVEVERQINRLLGKKIRLMTQETFANNLAYVSTVENLAGYVNKLLKTEG